MGEGLVFGRAAEVAVVRGRSLAAPALVGRGGDVGSQELTANSKRADRVNQPLATTSAQYVTLVDERL